MKQRISRFIGGATPRAIARLVVVGLATALAHRIWTVGITGWPDAALAVAIALALPIVDALAIARPAQIVSLIRAAIATEASKFDDHRQDDAGVLPDASDRRAPR